MGSGLNSFWDHLMAWFRGGLDSILADLNRTIDRLDRHTVYHNRAGFEALSAASKMRSDALVVEASAGTSFDEANKAAKIRDNIKRLVAA